MTAYVSTDEIVVIAPSGTSMAVSASLPLPGNTAGFVFAGVDENNVVRYPRINADGKLSVTVQGTVGPTSEGFINVQLTWDNMKTVVKRKNLSLQYVEETNRYFVFALDACIMYSTYISTTLIDDVDELQDFETLWKLNANYPIDHIERARVKTVESNIYASATNDSTFYMAIDLNNPNGSYRHNWLENISRGISLTGIHAVVVKDTAHDKWVCQAGVVLDVSPSGSNVSFLRVGTNNVRDTGTLQSVIELPIFPSVSNLTVTSGSLEKIANNYVVFSTDLRSDVSMPDANGNVVFPEPGDLVLNATRLRGNGSLLLHYHIWYFVD